MPIPHRALALLAALLTLSSASATHAAETVCCAVSADAILSTLRDTMPPGCEIHGGNGQITILAKSPNQSPLEIPLVEIEHPPLHAGRITLRGNASYSFPLQPDQPGGGIAYLEMKIMLEDGQSWSIMNTDAAGLAQEFSGHSSGRPFAVSFTPPPIDEAIRTVAVSLSITAAGTITLSASDGNVMEVVQDKASPAAESPPSDPAGAALVADVGQLATTLAGDRQRWPGSHLVSEDQRRLIEAERRLNDRYLAPAWLDRAFIPLEHDDRVVWIVAAMALAGLLLAMVLLLRMPRSLPVAALTPVPALGVCAFGYGMAAVGVRLPSGVPVAAAGLTLLIASLLALPVLGRRRQSAELRKIAALDVA